MIAPRAADPSVRSSLHAPLYGGRYEYVGRPGPSPALAAIVAAGLLRREHRVLDVGCGRADDLLALARLGFRHLVGIDHNPMSIRHARRRKGAERIDLRLATLDALQDEPPRSYDWILDTFLVNNLRHGETRAYLQRLARLLPKDGGLLMHHKAGARSPEATGRGGVRSPYFTPQGPPVLAPFAEWGPDGAPSYAWGFVQVFRRNAKAA